jgi:hypothetical protein
MPWLVAVPLLEPNAVPILPVVLLVIVAAIWFVLRNFRRKDQSNERAAGPLAKENQVHTATFDEPPIEDVRRAFEILLARGSIVGERASVESLASARVPDHAGPIFRSLAKQFAALRLPEVDVTILLHDGTAPDDAIGGWRLAAEPSEIDIRLAPPTGQISNPDGEVILDATWSPRASAEVAAHSTILHFVVRAVCGDRLPGR